MATITLQQYANQKNASIDDILMGQRIFLVGKLSFKRIA